MAKQVVLTQFNSLGGTDLSSYVKNGTLEMESDAQDSTTMGSAGWSEFLAGLRSGTLSFSAVDDVAASALDSIVWPLFGTVATFEVRLNSSVVGASNPKYTGSVLINKFAIGGSVGELAMKDLSFPTTGAITRAIV
jgi:hypothetical protein